MTDPQKAKEIASITQQLSALKEQIDNAYAETDIHIEKRDKLNAQFKKLLQEIHELKKQRDSLNAEVKTLKQQRDDTRATIKTIIEEVKAHKQKITELKAQTSQKTRQRELQKELEAIEWKIQTTPLEKQEEKRLIENVKQIESRLSVYRKIDKHVQKISELQKGLETLQKTADDAHRKLTETAKKSQETHAILIAKISESRNIKSEADNLHLAYVQAKEQSKPLRDELKKLTEKKKNLQDALRKEDQKQKKEAEKNLKDKLETQAREKLRRGEKLSFDEFKLLADSESENKSDGVETQN